MRFRERKDISAKLVHVRFGHGISKFGFPAQKSYLRLQPGFGRGRDTVPIQSVLPNRGSVSSVTSLPNFAHGIDYMSSENDRGVGKFRVTFFNKFGKKGTTAEGLQDASSVTHMYNGAVLVTDMLGSKIVLFSRSGRPEKSFITGEYTEPWSAVLTPKGHVAVTLRRHKCIAVWSGNGDTMAEFGHEHLRCPTGLAVEKDGRFIVTDEQANKVYIFSPSRVLQCVLGEEAGITFNQPRHVCLSTTGRIIVSDSGHHCVKIFNKDGIYVNKIGEFGSGDGQFKFPYGVCVDQEGHIIVSDHYNNRVSMFHADGTFMQHLVTAKNGVKRPRGVAVRCAHNRKLFVTHGGLRATEVLVFRMTLNVSELLINVKCFV
ncbi:tripartite motif-containing protein 2-like isoform X2 [Gigantopelta aegis]|uniref:tripartite motif-containing protein 2-like isoform X2 n=1 Tax=Gigantopelta aegis TaxID=1735272 RepID=UPI001B88B202|nr:tripartite motif-containing protein 2-like isoform X2 [Gigantopelta aegis]XP_041371858.1 tripartite motif-containing protein 2-like isoform X2 [Gigantopelta aegis]